ncbi:MAG: 16S rRNA (cytidine(1402)-2'-O)-methyltransferase, partial [Pseudohongiellaceae bacterium]
QRGEFVLLLQGAAKSTGAVDVQAIQVLAVLMAELPLNQAVALTAKITGQKKNLLYQQALQLKAEQD